MLKPFQADVYLLRSGITASLRQAHVLFFILNFSLCRLMHVGLLSAIIRFCSSQWSAVNHVLKDLQPRNNHRTSMSISAACNKSRQSAISLSFFFDSSQHGSMDPNVAKLVLAAKKDAQLELNVKVNKIMTILTEHGLLYEAKLHCNDILIHPQNRAGKMCLPAEVRAKGCKLLKAGADLSRLDGICFEVAATAAIRSRQFQANQDLQEQSCGKLAKVRFTERYLSVSGSHTVSFAKSVAQGCVTADPGLLEQ